MQRIAVQLACALALASTVQAQQGRYYLMNGSQHLVQVLQGGSVVQQTPQIHQNPGNSGVYGEFIVAVSGDIRTAGTGHSDQSQGSQYTLGGVYTGVDYNYPVAGGAFYDGATDGTWNYTLDFVTGALYRTDRNWSNALFLFNAGSGGAFGVTWDQSSNTLWTAGYYDDLIRHWSMNGNLLGSFHTGVTTMGALAMDYSDGSLWFNQANNPSFYHQYSTAGTQLQVYDIPTLNSTQVYGGEFDVVPNVSATPEPATLALMATGLFALVPITRRKMKRS